jgi:hypothetical protein
VALEAVFHAATLSNRCSIVHWYDRIGTLRPVDRPGRRRLVPVRPARPASAGSPRDVTLPAVVHLHQANWR